MPNPASSSSSAPDSAASPAPRRWRASRSRVTIVDRRNYHLFVPLLYQVATAALSPADIARPIRRILGRYENIDVVLGDRRPASIPRAHACGSRDGTRACRTTSSWSRPARDYSYFGHPEWAEFAPGPRTLEDARRIRARLLTAFERAEASHGSGRAGRADDDRRSSAAGRPASRWRARSPSSPARAGARLPPHRSAPRARSCWSRRGRACCRAFRRSSPTYAQAALERLGVTVMHRRGGRVRSTPGGVDGRRPLHRAPAR